MSEGMGRAAGLGGADMAGARFATAASAAFSDAAALCCCCCCCCCSLSSDIALAESSVSSAAFMVSSSPSGCSPMAEPRRWPRFGSRIAGSGSPRPGRFCRST